MRLRIISIWVVFVLAGLLPQLAKAQVAASNPLEWAALAEGNELINGQIDKQIKGQTQTALMQNSIAAEFNRIHEWEKQYNSYLKTANGYASSLKPVPTSITTACGFSSRWENWAKPSGTTRRASSPA